jgi:hypothetical protein
LSNLIQEPKLQSFYEMRHPGMMLVCGLVAQLKLVRVIDEVSVDEINKHFQDVVEDVGLDYKLELVSNVRLLHGELINRSVFFSIKRILDFGFAHVGPNSEVTPFGKTTIDVESVDKWFVHEYLAELQSIDENVFSKIEKATKNFIKIVLDERPNTLEQKEKRLA